MSISEVKPTPGVGEAEKDNLVTARTGSTDQGNLAKLASVLLSFSQDDTQGGLAAAANGAEDDESIPALSLIRLSPAPRLDSHHPAFSTVTSYVNSAYGKQFFPTEFFPDAPDGRSQSGSQDSSKEDKNNDSISIRAFAKFQGRSWEYYVQKLAVVLGRSPEVGQTSTHDVDVFLGSESGISKKHLRIEFNAAERRWDLYCFGRSGVQVNGIKYEPFCHPVALSSKSLIQVESIDFYFLLPMESIPTGQSQNSISSAATLDAKIRKRGKGRKSADNQIAASIFSNPVKSAKPSLKVSKTTHDVGREIIEEGLSAVDEEEEALSTLSDSEVPPGELARPALSYACLISEAINSVSEKRLTLSAIYKYLSDKYSYFRHTKSGWQNSIRHNLSLNKAFRKIPRSLGEPGKGMFWIVDPNFKHLVEVPPTGRRSGVSIGRNKSLQGSPYIASPYTSQSLGLPMMTPPLAQQRHSVAAMHHHHGPGTFVPILPSNRAVMSMSSASGMFVAPQLLEAAAAMDGVPSMSNQSIPRSMTHVPIAPAYAVPMIAMIPVAPVPGTLLSPPSAPATGLAESAPASLCNTLPPPQQQAIAIAPKSSVSSGSDQLSQDTPNHKQPINGIPAASLSIKAESPAATAS